MPKRGLQVITHLRTSQEILFGCGVFLRRASVAVSRNRRAIGRFVIGCMLCMCMVLPGLAQPEPREKPGSTAPINKEKAPGKAAPKQKGTSGSLAEEGRALFPDATGVGVRSADPSWRILIVAAQGPDAKETAELALWKVQNVGTLPEAYLMQGDEETWRVCYGRYASGTDPVAQADLRRIRETRIGTEKPFELAVLMPPADGETPITSPFDLRSVRISLPEEHARYTLAIAFYTRADLGEPTKEELAECRRLAEEAVAKLRREGDQAYFYHGPNGSQVTVGVFGELDHDPVKNPGLESAALKAARAKHPNYLLNGMGQRKTVNTTSGKKKAMVPSALVEIPR